MPQKKMAFIQAGNFSYTNAALHRIFTEEFSEYEIQIVQVFPELMRIRNFYSIANLWCAALEYKTDFLFYRRIWSHIGYLFRTRYAFKRIRQIIRQYLEQDRFTFTFQTQSLFDASLPDTPHFLYTDHTVLANVHYPDYHQKDFHFPWLECERSIYRNAHMNFTMSNNIANSIIEQYDCPPQQVACVYAGSNIGNQTPEAVDQQKYHSKQILFVGVEWERKGGPQLVEAFKKVLQKHPDAHLTIVGSSPKLTMPNCHVVGHVSREEVKNYYEQAAVFCLPTRREPFGIVFIEAMAYKLPVVATRIGAIPDFVIDGENGHLVEPDNIEDLAHALIDLLDHPDTCQAFGETGYQIAMERYNWARTGRLIREHIERTIAPGI